MSRIVTVAATQMACSWDRDANIANAERLVRQAAAQGAQIILIQELFETPYFCQKPNPDYLLLATEAEQNPAIAHFSKLAAELQVVLPISFFERAGRARFNSIAILDADGRNLGIYRKSHIPDGPGYHEKYYFNPGDTGFKVWNTRYAKIGVGICWDQCSRNARAAWRCRAPSCCSTRPPLAANPTTPPSARATTGSACSRAMPAPT